MSTTDAAKPLLQWLRLASDSTSDVFFACLAAIIASTFLALHLNVPSPPPTNHSHRRLYRWWHARVFRQFRRQCIWAAMCVLVPELLVGLAFGENMAASRGARAFHTYGHGDIGSWSKSHAFFANMGGLEFRVQFGGEEIPDSMGYADLVRPTIIRMFLQSRKTTLTKMSDYIQKVFRPIKDVTLRVLQPVVHYVRLGMEYARTAFRVCLWKQSAVAECAQHPGNVSAGVDLAQMPVNPGGNAAQNPTEATQQEDGGNVPTNPAQGAEDNAIAGPAAPTPMAVSQGSPAPISTTEISLFLNAYQIVAAQALGIIGTGPDISVEEIEDRGKTNVFVKGFAALQLFWFGARCVVQLTRGHTVTQLELATFTYVVCAMMAYCLYWSKPQGAELPIRHRVRLSDIIRAATERDIRELKSFSGNSFLTRNFVPPFGMDSRVIHDPRKQTPADVSISVFTFFGGSIALFDDDFGGVVAGMIFGLLYCLGWNHEFPSRWELLAWRVASIVITASLIPYSVANGVCTARYRSGSEGKTHIVHKLWLYGLLALYTACRVFMIVEMVRTLFS